MRPFLLLMLCCLPFLLSGQPLPLSVDSSLRSVQSIGNDSVRRERMYRLARHLTDDLPAAEVSIAAALLKDASTGNDRVNMARAHYAMGRGYQALNDYARALQSYHRALELRRQLQDVPAQVDLCIYISNIYDFTQDIARQKEYIVRAQELCRTYGLEQMKGTLLDEMATIYKKEGKLDSAVALYREGIRISWKQQDTLMVRTSLCNLATALKSQKDFAGSLRHYREAISLTDTVHDLYPYIVIMGNMSILFYEMGDYDQSREYARHILSMQSRIRAVSVDRDIYDVLRKIALKEGKYRDAITYYDQWLAARDTMQSDAQLRQMKELQARYDILEKDKQITTQHTQLENNRRINLFLGITSFLLLAIGSLIFFSQRKTDRLNRRILEQKAELERVNAVKDRIFSVISHDLKTPVQSLMTFMRLLEHGQPSAEKLQAYAGLLKESLGYTAHLMEHLLNWAYTQMQGYQPVREIFDVAGTVQETVDLLKLEADKKQIVIRNELVDGQLVAADINMTALILRNLLSNAIKYTPEQGLITIAARRQDDKLKITVEDSGAGMPEEVIAALNRSGAAHPVESRAGTNREKGTGLGLMLSKTFASLMQGQIFADSAPGLASRLTLILPAAETN